MVMTMANTTINIGDIGRLSATIESYLKEYEKDVTFATQQSIDEVSKEAVNKLKKNSPRGKSGRYGKGWAVKKGTMKRAQYDSTIYNKTAPGLAHLLENKHRIVDRNRQSHGVTNPASGKGGQVHILPVDEWVEQELPRRISQKIN